MSDSPTQRDPSPYDPEPMRRAKEVAAKRRKPIGFGKWLDEKSEARRATETRVAAMRER